MKIVEVEKVDKGTKILLQCGDSYLRKSTNYGAVTITWYDVHGNRMSATYREKLTCAYVRYLQSKQPTLTEYDKDVYFDKRWIPAVFVSSDGQGTIVVTKEFGEMEVPFFHIRDSRAQCQGCKCRFFGGASFQTVGGDSWCQRCYHEIDDTDIELMFHGHQWFAWEGQIAIRQMGQGHLINTLAKLRKNARLAKKIGGGKMEKYINPSFQHLVAELQRRQPPEERVKANGMLLQLYIVIMIMMGFTISRKEESEDE